MTRIVYCHFCYSTMEIVYGETTPAGYPLTVFECPKCFSTYYEGSENDSYFKFIKRFADAQLRFYEATKVRQAVADIKLNRLVDGPGSEVEQP